MFHDNRWWDGGWLGCVPVGLGFVQLGGQRFVKPPVIDGTFQSALPACFTETDQTFFALISVRICSTSWMMLLLFSGDRAISSLAAATRIQKAGWDRNSIAANECCV